MPDDALSITDKRELLRKTYKWRQEVSGVLVEALNDDVSVGTLVIWFAEAVRSVKEMDMMTAAAGSQDGIIED